MTNTKKLFVTLTITLDVTHNPDVHDDWRAASLAQTAVSEAILAHVVNQSPDAGVNINLRHNDNLTYTTPIPNGNGRSIYALPALTFDNVLDAYNNSRQITKSHADEHFKQYSHLLKQDESWATTLPWAGRTELLALWRTYVEDVRTRHQQQMLDMLRERLLAHIDGAFEDGVEPSTPDDVEPF